MICYKDKTFCPFHSDCAWAQPGSPEPCDRPLTDEVKAAARRWWGSNEAPIAQFSEKPQCHVSTNDPSYPLPENPPSVGPVPSSHYDPGNGDADRSAV